MVQQRAAPAGSSPLRALRATSIHDADDCSPQARLCCRSSHLSTHSRQQNMASRKWSRVAGSPLQRPWVGPTTRPPLIFPHRSAVWRSRRARAQAPKHDVREQPRLPPHAFGRCLHVPDHHPRPSPKHRHVMFAPAV